MLSIKDLSVTYHAEAVLEKFNMEFNIGEIYTFIGPSGCGKSTLLKVLAGITPRQGGEIRLEGKELESSQQTIGLIPQHYGLLPWKNVKQNISLGCKIKGQSKVQYTKKVEEMTKALELDLCLDKYPNALSGGQKQRVAIARAFAMAPELLLMDEPFSALDALTSEKAQELFLEIYKSHQVTTLFVTHNVEEAVYLGKYIIILSDKPCRILEVIENPVFGIEGARTSEHYYNQVKEIRRRIKEAWSI